MMVRFRDRSLFWCWITGGLCAMFVWACSPQDAILDPVSLERYVLSEDVIPAVARQAVELQQQGSTVYGFYVRQPDSMRVEPHPVVVYHHGANQSLQQAWPRIEYLWRCGVDVFVYDYRGYGMSTGQCTTDEDLMADAELALSYVRSRPDVDTTQIVEYGYALGSVPALWLAAGRHRAAAVILEAPVYDASVLLAARSTTAVIGPYAVKGAFDNASRVDRIRTKLLILHGTADRDVPIVTQADRLIAKAVQPKSYLQVKGADHHSIPSTLGVDSFIDLITAFVRGA